MRLFNLNTALLFNLNTALLSILRTALIFNSRAVLSTLSTALLLTLLLNSTHVQAVDGENTDEKNAETITDDEAPIAQTEGNTDTDTENNMAMTDDTQAPDRLRIRPYPDAERHQSLIDYLNLYQRQQEVMTLVTGESSFYGLFLRERSGTPQGGVLILHDLEQHGHWPTLVAPLREGLTEHGWTTLAIELPTVPGRKLPPRSSKPITITSKDSTNTEAIEADNTETLNKDANDTGITISATPKTDTEEKNDEDNNAVPTEQPDASDNYNQEIQARISAGLAHLNNQGQLNIAVIAIGDSAIWAAHQIQIRQRDNDNARGIALLMIDAREHPNSPLRLTQVLETLDIPILDFITGDNRGSKWEQQDRKGAMKRKHINSYSQIVQNTAALKDPSIQRRIRGWLKTHAAGTELPR